MGIFEAFIYESLTLRRQIISFHLAGGYHYRSIFTVDGVAVYVNVIELIIQADFLKLFVYGIEGHPVPKTDIRNSSLIILHHLPVKLLAYRKFAFTDVLQVKAVAGKLDIMGDVRLFHGNLIWTYLQRLEKTRHNAKNEKPYHKYHHKHCGSSYRMGMDHL